MRVLFEFVNEPGIIVMHGFVVAMDIHDGNRIVPIEVDSACALVDVTRQN
jgi:hypothetical protein